MRSGTTLVSSSTSSCEHSPALRMPGEETHDPRGSRVFMLQPWSVRDEAIQRVMKRSFSWFGCAGEGCVYVFLCWYVWCWSEDRTLVGRT